MKKKLLFFAAFMLIMTTTFAQFEIWQEDFETNGNTTFGGSRYTSLADFYDPASDDDYFGRVHGPTEQFYLIDITTGLIANSTVSYVGYNGAFFYAGEDVDDVGATIGNPDGLDTKTITFSNINIAGGTNLNFSGLFARGENDPCGASTYDDPDYIEVYYQIDGGVEMLGMCFNADLECNITGDVTNEPLFWDPNCDGDGGEGVELTNQLAPFSFLIGGTGLLLNLKVVISMDAGSEEIAMDYFRVFSDTTLGISESDLQNNLVLLPNPSNGLVTLKKSASFDLQKATVYDILGKKVKTINLENMNQSKSIDLTEFSSGLYLVNIKAENGIEVTKKLVIK